MSKVLGDKDVNAPVAGEQPLDKDVKSMEYHRQMLQSKMNECVLALYSLAACTQHTAALCLHSAAQHPANSPRSQQYVSPSDNIMSPCSAKINALRNKHVIKYVSSSTQTHKRHTNQRPEPSPSPSLPRRALRSSMPARAPSARHPPRSSEPALLPLVFLCLLAGRCFLDIHDIGYRRWRVSCWSPPWAGRGLVFQSLMDDFLHRFKTDSDDPNVY